MLVSPWHVVNDIWRSLRRTVCHERDSGAQNGNFTKLPKRTNKYCFEIGKLRCGAVNCWLLSRVLFTLDSVKKVEFKSTSIPNWVSLLSRYYQRLFLITHVDNKGLFLISNFVHKPAIICNYTLYIFTCRSHYKSNLPTNLIYCQFL